MRVAVHPVSSPRSGTAGNGAESIVHVRGAAAAGDLPWRRMRIVLAEQGRVAREELDPWSACTETRGRNPGIRAAPTR